jgi:AraC family transcriptional regulator
MSAIQHLQVFQSMNSSPNARLERCAELGDGLSAAIWSNHHDARDYLSPNHHTLSCYLDGGTGTFRGAPGATGAPDKLCIMPADQESAWIVNGDIRLAHLTSARSASPWAAYNARPRAARTATAREHLPSTTRSRPRASAAWCGWTGANRRNAC